MVKACSENLEACAETMSYSRENFYSLFDNVLRCVEKKISVERPSKDDSGIDHSPPTFGIGQFLKNVL